MSTTRQLTTYVVEVNVTDVGRYLIDVPTTQGPDAAGRRARIAVASRHPATDLDHITVGQIARVDEWGNDIDEVDA